MRYINIENARAGDIVALPVNDKDGHILVNTGIKLTKRQIEHLMVMDIDKIAIDDEISEGIDVTDPISLEIRPRSVVNLGNLDIDKLTDDANEIVNTLLSSEPELFEYFNVKNVDNYTYEHSVSVSVYAAMVGIALGYPESETRKLALAGILHDIGKKCIDPEIIRKPGKLTDEEYSEVKKHPTYGYNLVRDNHRLPATVKIVVLQHHENEDGGGYPQGLMSGDIYKFSKIVHICDVYDAIISKRPYKGAKEPTDAIQFICDQAGKMFDAIYVDAFIQIIPRYQRGSMVELSDGRKAVILRNVKNNIEKPDVRIVGTKEVIKLSTEGAGLTIVRSVFE